MQQRIIISIAAAAVAAICDVSAAPSFFLPERIYAVPGVECTVHYTRLFDSLTPNAYLLEARSPRNKGKGFATHWSYTPKKENAGETFQLVLNAWNDDGLVAAATTTVTVAKAPSAETKARRTTLALLAASDTNCFYQDRLLENMLAAGFSGYTPVGSHTGGSASLECIPGPTSAPHDGYGGYTWGSFLTRYAMTVEEIDNLQSEAEREQLKSFGVKIKPGNEWRKALLKSPIVRLVNGKKTVNVQAWFDKVNGGKAPDYIVISLGLNYVFLQRPDAAQDHVEKEAQTARKLVEVLRKAAPDTVIAITSSLGGSLDQDSWGKGYGTMQSCYIANRTFIDYNRAMKNLCETSGDPKLVYVPVSQGVDHLKAYPTGPVKGNALHPNKEGGQQIANALFAWLACDLGGK